jgi:hypothetical protein
VAPHELTANDLASEKPARSVVEYFGDFRYSGTPPSAFPGSIPLSSNSSWAASSFSLLAPKRRRTSKSIFSFSSLIS